MRSTCVLLMFAAVAGVFYPDAPSAAEPSPMPSRLTYPETRRGDQTDDYHGTPIPDPFRWLEDPNSEETKAWIEAQNRVTFGLLETVPEREQFRQRLTELWNYERFGLPRRRGQRYFYERNDGLQNQSVLFVAEGLDGEPRELLNPNKLSEDGTVALAGWVVSEDGRHLAYGIARAGSDWREWHVRDVETGEDQPDHLRWVKFSGVSWKKDNSGFFYSRYDEPQPGDELTQQNYYQKLYFHKLGDAQDNDTLVYERPDEKQWGFGGHVTEDGRYLIISVWRGTERKNQLFYQDLQADGQVIELLTGFHAEYDFIGNDGTTFFLVTDDEAPLRRLIAVDIARPDREQWREIIPASENVLSGVGFVGDHFLAEYLTDAHSQVRVFDIDGRHVRNVQLPAIGSAGGFGGRRTDRDTFYAFTNFTTPGAIYRYDIETGESELFRAPQVDFDPDAYVTRQVFCTSRDGTRVPLFITHRRDLPDGPHPTVLYGYGGFNISLTPSFSVSNLVWLENGGVYVVANLRGGGEYGRDWHEAGMKERKQNVFDDFIAAAEYLIEQGMASPQTLAIRGGSNGGLLVGAAMTQRPELFAAAIPAVGVLDMLRYHKFTIGWAWVSEFGSSDEATECETLLKYSPLHNLKPGVCYPATMITTADHDDRVVPAHSFKYAAALQAAHVGDPPVLIRIETKAGHGAGTPVSKRIEAAADELAFLKMVMGPSLPLRG